MHIVFGFIWLVLIIQAQKKTIKAKSPRITLLIKLAKFFVGFIICWIKFCGISKRHRYQKHRFGKSSLGKPQNRPSNLSADYFLSKKLKCGEFIYRINRFRKWIYKLGQHIVYRRYNSGSLKSFKDESVVSKRNYYGGRMLYHFKNTEKVDYYSGTRVVF